MSEVNYIISDSGATIYDEQLAESNPLYIPDDALSRLLNEELVGMDLNGIPLRTRSKVVKTRICEILGYPVPKSFKKTQPRFPAQNFDVYIQKSLNVQIWNESIDQKGVTFLFVSIPRI